MTVLTFDEINKLVPLKRSMPYSKYFGEMELTKSQIASRIKLANLFEEYFLYPLMLLLAIRNYGGNISKSKVEKMVDSKSKDSAIDIDKESQKEIAEDIIEVVEETEAVEEQLFDKAKQTFAKAYVDAIKEDGRKVTSEVHDYAEQLAVLIVETTKRHMGEPYYFSEDRLKFIAEEEANTHCNKEDHAKAVSSGNTRKRWVAIMDDRTRTTHANVNGKTIPINDMFLVGSAVMRFPRDTENASDHPEEICGCRCSIKYLR